MIYIKTMTVDGFYTEEGCSNILNTLWDLNFVDSEFGQIIENFNMIPQNFDEVAGKIMNMKFETYMKDSGVFRKPAGFIHFEGFDSTDDWMFMAAIKETTINIFEHKSGSESALDNYKLDYNNLFDWNLLVNYVLKPGQGIFFRPWLFHSISSSLVQTFRMKEIK
jgi:hypothetical protein